VKDHTTNEKQNSSSGTEESEMKLDVINAWVVVRRIIREIWSFFLVAFIDTKY